MAPKKPIKPGSFPKRVGVSLRGLGYAIKSQRHMRVHLVCTSLILIVGAYFELSTIEWALLILSVSLVVITECVNTAIEISVDLTTRQYRIRAMLSKDIASGAVVLAAVQALAIGYLLFFHRFITLIKGGC